MSKITFYLLVLMMIFSERSYGFDTCDVYKFVFNKCHIKKNIKYLPIKIDSNWFVDGNKYSKYILQKIDSHLVNSFKSNSRLTIDTLLSQVNPIQFDVYTLNSCKFKILQDVNDIYQYTRVSKLFWINRQFCFFREIEYYGGHGTSYFIIVEIKNGKAIRLQRILE